MAYISSNTIDNELRVSPEEHPDQKDSYVGDEAQSKRRKLMDEFDIIPELRESLEGVGRCVHACKAQASARGGRAHSSHVGQFSMLFIGQSPECESRARRATSRTSHTRCSWWSTIFFSLELVVQLFF